MTEHQHLAWDAAEEAVKAAIAEALAHYGRMPKDGPYFVAANRVAMALDSLETAQDQLAVARMRYADAAKPKEGV